jgi:hypothetical protein
MGWRFVSAAADLCQTLGYHRARPVRDGEHELRSAQTRLFWVVYRMEKGLSLRLARPSNIHDSEITLPPDPNEPRFVKQARIQGRVYAQLYSPTGLARHDKERGEVAERLAVELRELIGQTYAEISVSMLSPELFGEIPQRLQ